MSCVESRVPHREQLDGSTAIRRALAVPAALLTLRTWNVCGRTFPCIPACNLTDVCLVICLRLNQSLSLLNKCFVCFWWLSILHNISPPLFHLLWCIHLFFAAILLLGTEASFGRRAEPSGVSGRLYTVVISLGEMWLLFLNFKLGFNMSSRSN